MMPKHYMIIAAVKRTADEQWGMLKYAVTAINVEDCYIETSNILKGASYEYFMYSVKEIKVDE